MLERGFTRFQVSFAIGLGHQRGNGRGKTDAQGHSDKHEAIAKRYGSQFGRAQLPHHHIVHKGHKCMAQHPQNDRGSQLNVVTEFLGVLVQHAFLIEGQI